MALVNQSFADTFTFARPVAAPVRNAAGLVQVAPINAPRFDHDPTGARRGLLVEAGEILGQADRCRVRPGIWEDDGQATLLHEYAGADGIVVRRAYYTVQVRAAVDIALSIAGHHRVIGALPGFLKNLGGFVRYNEMAWVLAAAIVTGGGAAIDDGTTAHRPLIDG